MNITDLYSTRIQKTFDDVQAEIVSILKANPKAALKLISYYKGLPLSYQAKIVSIDRGTLDLDVQAEQAFAIEKSRSVFIRSPLFKHDVFAQAQFVNIKKKAASFVKFSYVEIMAERRNFIRVATESQPNTAISSPLGLIEGQLADISLSGMNIVIQHSVPLEIDSEAPTSFKLRNIEQGLNLTINTPARLINITGDKLPRNYKFTFNPDRSLERQLSQYIFQRQIEIIKEIKDAIE
jgi:c-di-GMP-binding flagellar brake protein YcgR